jgi:protein-S-isoprenylcysteine O-methyltransferase Ste14
MDKLNLKVPPAVVFLCCIGLMWLLNKLMPGASLLNIHRWIINLLLAIGALIAFAGVVQFQMQSTTVNLHKPNNASSLVTTGIYSISRNPMYFGMLILLFAYLLKTGQPGGLLVILLYIVYMTRFQIKPEEQVMEHKFGEAYRTYRQRVRRWI